MTVAAPIAAATKPKTKPRKICNNRDVPIEMYQE